MAKMDYPFQITRPSEEDIKSCIRDFTGEPHGYILVGPKNYCLPYKFQEIASDVLNFKLRPEDVWICTFPRSGTTLSQEILWLINNNMDFEKAKKVTMMDRFPHMETSAIVSEELKQQMIANAHLYPDIPNYIPLTQAMGHSILPRLDQAPSPRMFKTHVPLGLLPKGLLDTCKVVYICRNPKDNAISNYYYSRLLKTTGFVGNFEQFWDHFQRDRLRWCPFWEHIKEAWELRDHPNMLFMFYEDLIKDMPGAIRKYAEFLQKPITEEQVHQIMEHMKIENFRKNPAVNLDRIYPLLNKKEDSTFIRSGKSGEWRGEFSAELSAKADKWIEENIAKIPGFSFPKH